jgi:hypothetical protein
VGGCGRHGGGEAGYGNGEGKNAESKFHKYYLSLRTVIWETTFPCGFSESDSNNEV